MQIEIDGWRFNVDVEHYSPSVAGTYSYTADSDMDYLGYPTELFFTIDSVYDTESCSIVQDVVSIQEEYYTLIYDYVLEKLSIEQEASQEI